MTLLDLAEGGGEEMGGVRPDGAGADVRRSAAFTRARGVGAS